MFELYIYHFGSDWIHTIKNAVVQTLPVFIALNIRKLLKLTVKHTGSVITDAYNVHTSDRSHEYRYWCLTTNPLQI